VTWPRAGRPGFDFPQKNVGTSFSPPRPGRLWGPPSLLTSGYWRLSPGVKRPGREAGHLPTSRAEVKNAWNHTSTPSYVFMSWCLVGQRDKFTFTLKIPTWRQLRHLRLCRVQSHVALHHRVQTGSGAHPASYPIDTRGSFPEGKAAGA
jgi:hypothetical protein